MARKIVEKPFTWFLRLPGEGIHAYQFRKLNEEYFTLAGKLRADAPHWKYEEYALAQLNDSKVIQEEVKSETKSTRWNPTKRSKFFRRLYIKVVFRLHKDKGLPKSRARRVYRY